MIDRSASSRIVGAFVFPEFWDNPSRLRSKLHALKDVGVNSIMTENDRYDFSAIEATRNSGLRFYAGVACFSDHSANFRFIKKRPELWPILENGERRSQMEWYVGMTPTDSRRQEEVLATIGSIARTYPVDGLFLDFVRWPLHWEIELRPGQGKPMDSSFDPTTLAKFEAASGALPGGLDSIPAKAAWIRENRLRDWINFKCQVITDFVAEARNVLKHARPDAELGVYVVPDMDGLTEPLTGQRIRDLEPLADWIAPMLYHNILLQPPAWVGAALKEVSEIAKVKTLPVVQADSNRDPNDAADWGPPMSAENFTACLSQVGTQSDIGGLIVFPGRALLKGRGAVLRAMTQACR
jgi:hypothetical protein